MEGGCTCRHVRYQLVGTPMIVHACHCRWCQREIGTVHALNAVYEAEHAGSLKYSNGVAVSNHSCPGLPIGHSRMASSSTCSLPSRTRPTVPLCASHSALSQAVKPSPSVAP